MSFYNIFSSVANVAPQYHDMDWYVIQRLYELQSNIYSFCRNNPENMPSDDEIVCAVFCARLDYYGKDVKDLQHPHFYDNTASIAMLSMLKKEGVAIKNTQPRYTCRPHFELVINNCTHPTPSVSQIFRL